MIMSHAPQRHVAHQTERAGSLESVRVRAEGEKRELAVGQEMS
jgi:hypothetical protein